MLASAILNSMLVMVPLVIAPALKARPVPLMIS
jgi:hypothetical protein